MGKDSSNYAMSRTVDTRFEYVYCTLAQLFMLMIIDVLNKMYVIIILIGWN